MPERYAPFYCPEGPLNPPRRPRRPPAPPSFSALHRPASVSTTQYHVSPSPSQRSERVPTSLARELDRQSVLRRNELRRPGLTPSSHSTAFNTCACCLCVGAAILAPLLVLGFYLGPPGQWVAVGISSASVLIACLVVVLRFCRKRRQRIELQVNVTDACPSYQEDQTQQQQQQQQ
eukprot:scpid48178/ scgid1148/ 